MEPSELILIVEDSAETVEILSRLLSSNYRVRVATNAEEGLCLAHQEPVPDLILLDILMPDQDGYSLCTQLKAAEQTRDIPVVFLSSQSGPQNEARAFEMGAADFISKPINPAVLRARVRAQLALAHQIKITQSALAVVDQQLTLLSEERIRSESERQRLQDRQQALLAVTSAGLKELTLQRYLMVILGAIKAVSWLEVEPRGALFMFNRQQDLVRVAHHGLDDGVGQLCVHAKGGRCACQTVAMEARPRFFDAARESGSNCLMSRRGEGFHSLPLIEGDRVYGVFTVLAPAGHQPSLEEVAFLQDAAQALTSVVRRRVAEETVRITQLETQLARNEVIRHLGIAAEFRDTETGLHIVRMSKYAGAIALAMGCDDDYAELIELAAPMHDVGKIGIHDGILRKPDKLTEAEFRVMQDHTLIGARILEGDDPLIQLAREIALTHHEKWDGSGYPRGLSGEAIPLSGRICAVADVFDALTIPRPYKPAWTCEEAVDYIESSSGTAFDARVVEAFSRCIPELRGIQARYHDGVVDPRDLFPVSHEQSANVWIPWKETFSVGIGLLDEHHRYLLDWINRIHQAIEEEAGTLAIAKGIFALEQYARIHFRAEERLMESYGYDDLEMHKEQHRSFELELGELRAEINHNPFIVGPEIQEFLRNWLLSHILKSDRQILAKSRGLKADLPSVPRGAVSDSGAEAMR